MLKMEVGNVILEVTVLQAGKKDCSRRESNPRPLVHKTSALPIELQELGTNLSPLNYLNISQCSTKVNVFPGEYFHAEIVKTEG